MKPSVCCYLAASLLMLSCVAAMAQGASAVPSAPVAVLAGAALYAQGREYERHGR